MKNLSKLLDIEELDINLFRSHTHKVNISGNLYGGQVLSQALVAAQHTVEDRKPHSMHAYFLRAGTDELPVIYEVDPIRDGGSFSTRRVVAKQRGRAIFNCSISFHKEEPGYTHQMPALELPPVPDESTVAHYREKLEYLPTEGLFDFLPVKEEGYMDENIAEPHGLFWFRCLQELPPQDDMHYAGLTFISDMGLLTTALFPHPSMIFKRELMLASLDHAIWFHEPFNVNEWLLYQTDSPWSGNARGFNRGSIYSADGLLVASTAQEGLMRPLKKN